MVHGVEFVEGQQLRIAFERSGPKSGWPVVLLHGFPYDPRCYDDVAAELARHGADVVVPYLRGFGPTQYRDAHAMRSGQQAALASDLRELIAALGLRRPIVAGFDWGGRAACVCAMLWPDLVSGLVTAGGYNVHDIAVMSSRPDDPAEERRNWYQWYFHSERGRRGLEQHRAALALQLWREWSPTWEFSEDVFDRSRPSLETPDFVDTVIHSYRHRYGIEPGDPVHADIEAIIATQPRIGVPTVVLDGAQGTLVPPVDEAVHRERFPALLAHRVVEAGHNVPQEAPTAFVRAVLDLHAATATGP